MPLCGMRLIEDKNMIEGYKAYDSLVKLILHSDVRVQNKRTQSTVYMLDYPAVLSWDLESGHLPIVVNRRVYPHIAAAEFAWFMRGEQDITFMQMHGVHIWDKFADSGGAVLTAYGYRWLKQFSFDQIEEVIKKLNKDPSTRQAYVQTWSADPEGRYYKEPGSNAPCQIGFHFNIIEGRLDCTVFARSSDVLIGLPYDLMVMAMVMKHVQAKLLSPPVLGQLHFVLSNAHIYKRHVEAARESVTHNWTVKPPYMSIPLCNHCTDSEYHEFVKTVQIEQLLVANWPVYAPKLEVVV